MVMIMKTVLALGGLIALGNAAVLPTPTSHSIPAIPKSGLEQVNSLAQPTEKMPRMLPTHSFIPGHILPKPTHMPAEVMAALKSPDAGTGDQIHSQVSHLKAEMNSIKQMVQSQQHPHHPRQLVDPVALGEPTLIATEPLREARRSRHWPHKTNTNYVAARSAGPKLVATIEPEKEVGDNIAAPAKELGGSIGVSIASQVISVIDKMLQDIKDHKAIGSNRPPQKRDTDIDVVDEEDDDDDDAGLHQQDIVFALQDAYEDATDEEISDEQVVEALARAYTEGQIDGTDVFDALENAYAGEDAEEDVEDAEDAEDVDGHALQARGYVKLQHNNFICWLQGRKCYDE